MNIGIDARLLERRITGIGRSLMILINEIPKYDKVNNYFLFTYQPIKHENFYKNIPTIRSIIPQKLFSPIWSTFILTYYLKKNNIDVLFCINQVVPLIKVKGCKYISVLNDVIYKQDRSFLPFVYRIYLQILTYFSTKISDIIITISEYSKRDILTHYEINSDKVRVVYPSANEEFQPIRIDEEEIHSIKSSFRLSEKVVLYVGVIERRKNILGILKVADKVMEKRKDVSFLLVGKMGHGSKKIYQEIKKRENIILLTNVDDGTLKKLYNIADVFLFPSLYEGFGFPPLEAMQCGLPVLASDNTSLKEILEGGGILFNPFDYDSFANTILMLLIDEVLHKSLSIKGIEQAKKYTVEKYVKGMIDVFNLVSRDRVNG